MASHHTSHGSREFARAPDYIGNLRGSVFMLLEAHNLCQLVRLDEWRRYQYLTEQDNYHEMCLDGFSR